MSGLTEFSRATEFMHPCECDSFCEAALAICDVGTSRRDPVSSPSPSAFQVRHNLEAARPRQRALDLGDQACDNRNVDPILFVDRLVILHE